MNNLNNIGSAAQLSSDAREIVGVDLVDTEIQEALSILLLSLKAEAQLSESGTIAMKERLLRILCNRLRMMTDYQNHPEINDQKIVRPLFLTGGGRTGSTKLHKLLAASGDFKYLPFWQAHHPSLRSGDRKEGPATRIQEADEFVKWFDSHAPKARMVHAYDTLETEEETHIYEQATFGFYIFSVAFVPGFMAWYATQDFSKMAEYFSKVMKYLQWQFHDGDPRPWIFKYPAYQSYEPELRRLFPDATLVATHRNPVSTLTSSASLFSAYYEAYSDAKIDKTIGAMMVEGQAGRIDLLLQARKEHPNLGVLDIGYTELTRSVDSVIEKIYKHADMPLSDQARVNMSAWENSNIQHKHGAHKYTPEQFGLELTEAEGRYQAYTEQFGHLF